MNKYIYSTLLFSTLLLSACDLFKNSPKVILPETQPLEAGKLASTAQTCKKEIEELESRSAYVPKERREEFDKVVSMASRACEELTTTYERLKAASHQEKTYRLNVQHARSTMLEGRVESAESPSNASSSSDYGSADMSAGAPITDVTPVESHISDEPLS